MKRLIVKQNKVVANTAINCSTKSYPYKGYRIYDTGNGFKVYKDGQQQSDTEFVAEDEAEDFIDGLEEVQ